MVLLFVYFQSQVPRQPSTESDIPSGHDGPTTPGKLNFIHRWGGR